MQSPDTAGANGRPASRSEQLGGRPELDRLRAICRSQALMIDALGEAMSALRRGAAALKAENAELRADPDRLRGSRRGRATGRDMGAALAVRLPCDVRAPGAARIVVAHCLRGRVAAGVLDSAQLLVSELVTNSVRHSGAGAADGVIVRVQFTRTLVRLEVADAGRGGVIAPPSRGPRRRRGLRPAARAGAQRALGPRACRPRAARSCGRSRRARP
jgi:signal transduction histidine kinase